MSQPQQQTQPPINPVAVGIDLGSFQSVLAVAKKTGVEVLTNQANFRETPNVVGFGATERYLGESGMTKLKTNFNNTICFITRFLGLPANSAILEEQTKYITARCLNTGARVQFEVTYRNEKATYVSQQIVAAFLNKLLTILEINKISRDEPVVLSVPSYYNIFERRALLDAAKIAGMKVCRLLNESTAVALDYCITRRNEFYQKDPRYVCFVDFGHSKLTISTIGFTKEKITVVAQHNDRNLGCRDMDYSLVQFYRQVFRKSSNGIDLMESKKAFIKLLQTVEKQRKVLSANSEHGLHMEYLVGQEDLNYTMKREEFEKIIETILKKIAVLIEKHKAFLDTLKIKLHNIELVGGGTRIPAVIKIIQNVFKVDPSRTINSSEAIAKGCALMSAFKNPLFRPADVIIEEFNCNPVKACWNFLPPDSKPPEHVNKLPTNYPQTNQGILFPYGCPIPTAKQLRFKRPEVISLLLAYDPPIPGFDNQIAYFQSRQHRIDAAHSLSLNFNLDQNGFISLSAAYIDQDNRPNPNSPKLPCLQLYPSNLTPQLIISAANFQKTMSHNDKSTQQLYECKNKMESYIYTTKQKLTTTYKEYISPTEHEQMSCQLDKINQWLYDTDPFTIQKEINTKSEHIGVILEPINVRIRYQEEYYKTVAESHTQMDVFIKTLQSSQQQKSVPDKQCQWALNEVVSLKTYISSAEEGFKKHPKFQNYDPSTSDINRMMMTLKEKIEAVLEQAAPKNVPRSTFLSSLFNRFK